MDLEPGAHRPTRLGRASALCALVALTLTSSAAAASGWWPHPANADWVYSWSDSTYAPTPTTEKVTVKDQSGQAFTLAWTTDGQGNPADALTSSGSASFSDGDNGITNTDWSSTPPPPTFPVLCASSAGCPNSLASALYNLIWGSRDPVIPEPLLAGMSWTGTGGAQGDVSSSSSYQGLELVKVPAFPDGIEAAKIHSDITQAGAKGDPYGSGARTVWWVYGVGPVKIDFQHAGGSDAPDTTVELQSTNQQPQPPPSDANYFPYTSGQKLVYRWTNPNHLKRPEIEQFTIDAVVNQSARFSVTSLSGPIKVAGSYGFSTRASGITNLWGNTAAATRLNLPPLGPSSLPRNQRRHFFTPFDLMDYGFNPILTAYPTPGQSWTSKIPSRDYSTFGVTGTTRILGTQTIHVPAGTYTALEVKSTLNQKGFPYGSGTRTSWFAPGKGLIKLVFHHKDGSTSTVERIK